MVTYLRAARQRLLTSSRTMAGVKKPDRSLKFGTVKLGHSHLQFEGSFLDKSQASLFTCGVRRHRHTPNGGMCAIGYYPLTSWMLNHEKIGAIPMRMTASANEFFPM
jgi:hypothetical protein